MDSLKLEIESYLQFAIALIGLIGTFLIKPDMFNLYNDQHSFLAGDPGIFIMFIMSVALILAGMIFNKPKYTWCWGVLTIVSACLFLYSFSNYNKDLKYKTFLASTAEAIEPVRVIKGNNYNEEIKRHCDLLEKGSATELEIIQNCANIKSWNDLDKIWPKEEIYSNTMTLMIDYYGCLILGGLALIASVQAIKCKRNNTPHETSH